VYGCHVSESLTRLSQRRPSNGTLTVNAESVAMYVRAPKKMTPRLAKAGRLGHCRPVKRESQTATRIGVELRKTMNVSTFAYWRILVFVNMHMKYVRAAGKKARKTAQENHWESPRMPLTPPSAFGWVAALMETNRTLHMYWSICRKRVMVTSMTKNQ
jgi:hypothetical protein